MAAHAKRIEIAAEDRPALEKLVSSRTAERRLVERAQIVLLAAEGRPVGEIAERVGCVAETARRQRARYEREGLDGLRDRPKSGRPMTHDQTVRARLIALACTRPPDTEQGLRRDRWTLAELAGQVGMSVSRAQAILAEADLRPHLTEYWVMSELGPDFDAQAAEVCGLYVDPPANAIVVSVDEKTSIAAREPARPDTPPAPGRPARRDSEYLRNGTQNLFAALRVLGRGLGQDGCDPQPVRLHRLPRPARSRDPRRSARDRRARQPLHAQDQSVEAWLEEHPPLALRVHPQAPSWLNQVEMFFSILARRLLRHGQFTDPHDLAVQMLAFVEHHNLTAKPFRWTYTGKVLAAWPTRLTGSTTRASPPSRELSSYSWLAFACGGTTPFTTALFRDYAPRRATRVCAVAMIVFGCAVTDGDKYRRFAETGIRRAAEPDSALLLRHGAPSIQTAYNSLLQEAGARPDLEALVLLHQDAELLERDLAEKLRICMGDPLVAVVGVAGSNDVHSLEWWGGMVGGVVMPEITGPGRVGGTPPRGWPVDSVDGLLLALSPWAVRMLRFDESFAPYFHGYDVDLCFQARERGRRVVVADVNVAHHAGLDYFDRQSWVPAYILWHRKWGRGRAS